MSCYLGLDPNFDEAAYNGEHVADDEQDIPAVDELHPVSPAHTAAKFVFEKLHVLLIKRRKTINEMVVYSGIRWLCYVLFEFAKKFK